MLFSMQFFLPFSFYDLFLDIFLDFLNMSRLRVLLDFFSFRFALVHGLHVSGVLFITLSGNFQA
jgi:hypothetical protein